MKIFKKICLICYLFVLPTLFMFGQKQNFRFDHFSVKDGLSQVCVNEVIQDKHGFLWFATNDGLNRYDGYAFTVFKPNAGDSTSLSNNVIKTVYEDFSGDIWVGTAGGGICQYDVESNRFNTYNLSTDDETDRGSNDVYTIFQDSDSIIWIGTYGGGLKQFDKQTGKFKHYVHSPSDPQSISGNAIRSIAEDKNGFLWVAVDGGGLNRMHKVSETFKTFSHNPADSSSLSSDVVMSLYYDEQEDDLWIGTYGGGICRYDISNDNFITFKNNGKGSLSNNIVWSITDDKEGNLIVGTRGGGFDVFNKKTKQFENVRRNPSDPYSLSDNAVLCVLVDDNGVWWVGTENGGVNRFAASQKKFDIYQPASKLQRKAEQNNVYAIISENENIWAGTRGGGLVAFDQEFLNVTNVTDEDPSLLKINTIVKDTEGNTWIGTDGSGLFCLDNSLKIKKHYHQNSEDSIPLANNAVTSLYFDKENNLWIGTFGGGLNKLDVKTGIITQFPVDAKNQMKNVVLTLFEDSQDRLWVGTNGHGLLLFDKANDSFKYYKNDRNSSTTISNNVVYSIHEDNKGFLWIGTGGGGLNKFDVNNKEFIAYTQHDGLANDMVIGILQDETRNLWLSTYNGLSRFNLATKEFQNYFVTDGLPSNTFNEGAFLKTKDGKMFFGTTNGVIAFYPDSIVHNNYKPQLVLSDFKVYNKSVAISETVNGSVIFDKSIYLSDHIDLSYKHNVISFEFAALDFAAPGKIRYQYKMENFNDDWIETSADNRFATYTSLPGGKYRFKVRSTNSDGVWTDNTLVIDVNVEPPFWKTSWFYSIVVLLILLLIYLYVKLREHQHIVEKNRLEVQVRERTQEINMQKEELQRQSELLEEKNDDLTRTNMLMNDSIDYAKRIQDAMLPDLKLFENALPDSFVLYKPKDKVSGDFYWFFEDDEKIFIVAADCTGHGVPGAFMSMIGTTLLNEIIIEKNLRVPSEILKQLNTGVVKALNQNVSDSHSQDDGMDISISCVNKATKKIEIACANHAVYIIQDGNLNVVQGDIFSIGGIFSLQGNREFTNHVFDLKENTFLYMFSDGYQDQFGGERNKKFMANRFRDMLYDQHTKTMEEQCKLLDEIFYDWKGKNKQVDDVLVMGIRL